MYAFNWYDIGAVLPRVGSGLGADPAQLGIVLGAFLLGVGLFQIPAGFAAIRFGSRPVSLVGLVVLGATGVVCAFSPSWPVLAAIRFAGGVGAAFFFSPALSLIASYFPEGRRGPVIGFFNGGFSVGGSLGLFGGAYLGNAWGWQGTMAVGGAALLVTTFAAWLVLPRLAGEAAPGSLVVLWHRGSGVLRSRSLWALSLGLTGFWGALYVLAQYFVKYGHDVHPEWGLAVAPALSAALVIVSFPGGPVGGWLAERGFDRRVLAGIFGASAGALVLLIPFVPLAPLVFVMIALGFADGLVFAILYLIPSYLPESRGQGLALGVALVNSIQVILGGTIAVVFGFLVAAYGYTIAWEVSGALAVLLVPLLGLVALNRAGRSPVPPRSGVSIGG